MSMTKKEQVIKILLRLDKTGWNRSKPYDWVFLEKAVDKILEVCNEK